MLPMGKLLFLIPPIRSFKRVAEELIHRNASCAACSGEGIQSWYGSVHILCIVRQVPDNHLADRSRLPLPVPPTRGEQPLANEVIPPKDRCQAQPRTRSGGHELSLVCAPQPPDQDWQRTFRAAGRARLTTPWFHLIGGHLHYPGKPRRPSIKA
jgi:hypothetical protein